MKTTILSVLAAITLFISSCSTTSPCYSISQGKAAPTPITKTKEVSWDAKFSKTPYYNKPKKQKHKKVRNYYETKWYDRW